LSNRLAYFAGASLRKRKKTTRLRNGENLKIRTTKVSKQDLFCGHGLRASSDLKQPWLNLGNSYYPLSGK